MFHYKKEPDFGEKRKSRKLVVSVLSRIFNLFDGEGGGTDYTAIAGSTVVSIKASTLEKLSKGGHTITVTFKDGTAG